ncbi:DUF2092 domain-containing protein [Azospirillum doebereinerae]
MKRLMWLSWSALCASLMLGPALGAETPLATDGPPRSGQAIPGQAAQESAPVDARAMAVLKRMAEYLAQAPRFRVTMRTAYDVVQDSGEKIEFGERRMVTLSRSDGLRVEVQGSDEQRRLVVFDGRMLTVFDAGENVYAQVEKAGSVDDVVRYLVQDLQVRVPLALLLVSTLPAELEQRLTSLDYVERDALTATPTDHLAGQTADVDFQVWIATGDEPLPQRVVITYKMDEGEPQFRAELSDWSLNPEVSPARFTFEPPQGAERIAMLARIRRAEADKPQNVGPQSTKETPRTPEASGSTGGPSK